MEVLYHYGQAAILIPRDPGQCMSSHANPGEPLCVISDANNPEVLRT